MMLTFLLIFFEPAKQHWAGGMGEKGSHCPMLLSEIVATSLSYSEYRPCDILVQIKMADFEEIETLMVFLSCSTPKKRHLFLCSPQKYR